MTGSIVVLSGGMDSATALAVAREETTVLGALSFNYGQRHAKELHYAHEQAAAAGIRHDIVDLTSLGVLLDSALTSGGKDLEDRIEVPEGHYEADTMKATVVPNRNMIMFSIAAGVALSRGAETVWVGVHAGDHAVYPDCRSDFVDSMNDVFLEAMDEMSQPGHAVPALVAPFVHLSKDEIAVLGDRLGVNYALTWSCYKGGEIHCGKCGTCVERKEAFRLAGVIDPTKYEDPKFEIEAYDAEAAAIEAQ